MATRRPSAATPATGNAAAKPIVINDELMSSTFLTKGAWPDVKRFLIAAQTGVPAAPKFRKICQLALDAITTESISAELQTALDGDAEIATAFSGVHLLLTQAIKSRIKDKDFANVLKEVALAPAYADELGRTLVTSRAPLQQAAALPTIDVPHLSQLRWRTDVTISTTALERVFRPTVLMQTSLSDGSIKQFECAPEQFQQLRLQVALALRNMQTLAKHPTLIMNAEQQ